MFGSPGEIEVGRSSSSSSSSEEEEEEEETICCWRFRIIVIHSFVFIRFQVGFFLYIGIYIYNQNMNNYTFSLLFWSFLHSNVSADEVSCATYRSKNNPLLVNNDRSNVDDKYLTVIGHRGSSFHLPEHTLAGYRLAMELGADYIEPDLVPTKDGHLIAVHSIDLNITTDVASKFPDRFREGLISNNTNSTHFIGPITGYMSFDFTLEEIKTLKVKQRVEDTLARSQFFDWVFEIPTLEEILDLMLSWDDDVMKLIGRDFRPGLYAELKNPSFINNVAKLNSTVESMFLNSLKNHPGSEELFFNSTKYCEVGDLSNRESFISASVREGFSEKVNEYKTKSHLGLAPLVFQCFEVVCFYLYTL